MELNRDHYFAIGLILLLLGLQFRFVESFTLTPETTRFLAEKFKKDTEPVKNSFVSLLSVTAPSAVMTKQVRPPRWIGFSLLSIGAVLILYCIAMKKPGS
ncbi:MAG: hypothetical protein ACC628_19985 [Pirellulaceae bacterium]